jgi:hypothetical protein
MAVFVGSGDACWLCAGSGRIMTGAAERLIKCGMCSGVGISDIMPSTTDEMVGFGGVALSGVAACEFSENAPDPLALAAETVKRYCEPLVSPVTVFEIVVPLLVVTVSHVDPTQYFTE